MWPGTELNRRHGDFQYLASLYVSVTYGDGSPYRHYFLKAPEFDIEGFEVASNSGLTLSRPPSESSDKLVFALI